MRTSTNIYHRRDGRWGGRYSTGRGSNGRLLYRSVFARSYAECKAKRDVEMKKASPAPKNPVRLKDVLQAYIDLRRVSLKASSVNRFEQYLRLHIAPYFDSDFAHAVDKNKAQKFVNHLLNNGLSVSTAQAVISFLQSALGVKFGVCYPTKPKREAQNKYYARV